MMTIQAKEPTMTSPNESPESVLTKEEQARLLYFRANPHGTYYLDGPSHAAVAGAIDRLVAQSASDAAKIGELKKERDQWMTLSSEHCKQRDEKTVRIAQLESSLSSSVEQAKRMGEVVYEADRLSKGVGTYRELDAALAALSPPAEALSQSRPVDGQGGELEALIEGAKMLFNCNAIEDSISDIRAGRIEPAIKALEKIIPAEMAICNAYEAYAGSSPAPTSQQPSVENAPAQKKPFRVGERVCLKDEPAIGVVQEVGDGECLVKFDSPNYATARVRFDLLESVETSSAPAAQQEEEYEGWRVWLGVCSGFYVGVGESPQWFITSKGRLEECKPGIGWADELTGPDRIARIKEAIAAGLRVEKEVVTAAKDMSTAALESGAASETIEDWFCGRCPICGTVCSNELVGTVCDCPMDGGKKCFGIFVRDDSKKSAPSTLPASEKPPQRSAVDEARDLDSATPSNAELASKIHSLNQRITKLENDAKLAEMVKPAEKVDGREVYRDRRGNYRVVISEEEFWSSHPNGKWTRKSANPSCIRDGTGIYAPYTILSGSERDEVLARLDAKMGEVGK